MSISHTSTEGSPATIHSAMTCPIAPAPASQPADLGRVHATGVDDDLGFDVPPLGAHAPHAPVADVDAVHPRVGEDPPAAAPGSVGQGVGQLRGVQIAVGGQVGGCTHAV